MVGLLCPRCLQPMARGIDTERFTEWSCDPCDLVLHQMKLTERGGRPLLRPVPRS